MRLELLDLMPVNSAKNQLPHTSWPVFQRIVRMKKHGLRRARKRHRERSKNDQLFSYQSSPPTVLLQRSHGPACRGRQIHKYVALRSV